MLVWENPTLRAEWELYRVRCQLHSMGGGGVVVTPIQLGSNPSSPPGSYFPEALCFEVKKNFLLPLAFFLAHLGIV